MFTFNYKVFANNLDIEFPTHEGIPNNSPIHIFYSEKSDLSKHEILKRFYKILQKAEIPYLRPISNITGEWIFNLKEFRHNFDCLKDVDYLKGAITIEPECIRKTPNIDSHDENLSKETIIKFSLYEQDLKLLKRNHVTIPAESTLSLKRFIEEFQEPEKCGFLMMKFEDSKMQLKIIEVLKNHLKEKGITLLRADDKWYADDLFENIKTYMQGCSFGIALFDKINTEEFNPNVSLEIGYMMALNKPVLLLKDKNLKSLQTDLVGKLYHQFDSQNPEKTIPIVIDKWLNDKEI